MKTLTIKLIALFVIICLMAYLGGAFVAASFDITQWETAGRVTTVTIVFVGYMYSAIIVHATHDE